MSRVLAIVLAMGWLCGCRTATTNARDTKSDDDAFCPEYNSLVIQGDDNVDVVCEPIYYAMGMIGGDYVQLRKAPDDHSASEISWIILRVVKPDIYAGKIISIHHDGMLASGDARRIFCMDRMYAFSISTRWFGQIDYSLCSGGWPIKEIAR